MVAKHFRAHQRFTVRLPVTVASVQRPVASKGTTVDLGIGGGAFELDTPLRLGEEVQITIEGTTPLRFPAEVAWVGWAEASAVRLGVRFEHENATGVGELLLALGVAADVG
jgi:hypothetical protein